jgi:hypothetical protein
MEVKPEQLKAGALHVDDTRLGGMHGPFEFLQDLRDGLQGLLGLASRVTDNHQVSPPGESRP